MTLKKYSVGLHNCCQRIMSAQNELCAATQALSQHLRVYELQKFPLESENSILASTLEQFAVYIDNISSLHQVLAAQFSETMMYPMSKAIQADLDEISTMYEMFQIATHEHEHALSKYMKVPKKKEKEVNDCNEELSMMRKKFHQTSLHYYSALNSLQYKRKCFLLEPIIGYLHAQKSFFSMGQETICKQEMDDFLQNISASIQSIHAELQVETKNCRFDRNIRITEYTHMLGRNTHQYVIYAITPDKERNLMIPFIFNVTASVLSYSVHAELQAETKKTVDLIDTLEQQSIHMYYAEPPINMPYIPPNIGLGQKSGYLFGRSKQLIGTKWDKCFFFTQGGNLMSQAKDEVAGSLVLDLNLDGIYAEPTEADDRRNVFQISTAKQKRLVVLQAENERERDEWIVTINNIARDSGYVRGKSPSQGQQKLERGGSQSSQGHPRSSSTTSDSSQVANHSQSGAPTPSTGPNSPFLPEAPIQFDLMSPKDENGTVGKSLDGPPKRLNPFDQSSNDVIDTLDTLDQAIEGSGFVESFMVRFLGSMEVKQDRGEKLVHETIRQIMAARAIHNVFKMTESRMVVSSDNMRLIDPSTNTVRIQFALEDISFWAAHQENNRLFAFITRNKTEGSFACHVFECNVSAGEICQAIGTATKMAFHALMEKKAADKIKTLKDKEKNLLLQNIGQLEDKGSDEEDSLLSSNLPLASDNKYLVLTAPDDDIMDEMDKEMNQMTVNSSPRGSEKAEAPTDKTEENSEQSKKEAKES